MPLAPWKGGFYEQLVGLCKRAIRKTIGRKVLHIDDLQTLLTEIESTINSRPLTLVSTDDDIYGCLTPAEFLLRSRHTPLVLSAEPCPDAEFLADPDCMLTVSTADELRALWSDSMVSLQHFWQVWQRDYLLLLRERLPYHRGGHTHGQAATAPAVDDIVIIQDTSAPRTHWQLGRVRELILSHDDQVCSAIVETSSKRLLTRPINHLYPLELHAASNTTHADQPLSHSNEQSGTVPPSHPRRAAAQRAMEQFEKLDL